MKDREDRFMVSDVVWDTPDGKPPKPKKKDALYKAETKRLVNGKKKKEK